MSMNKNIKIQITSNHYPPANMDYIERIITEKLDDPKSHPEAILRAGAFKIESDFIGGTVKGVFWQKSVWVDGKEVKTDEFDRYELMVSGLQPSSTSETYETDDHTISISWE